MSRPKLFKKFSSKDDASKSNPASKAFADDQENVPQTFTSDNPLPTYPDGLKEAWGATHRELPQAQGAEKLLNNIGG